MSNPSTMPSYALINHEELTRLISAGANRSAITTYLCLVAHDYKRDGFVFPSIKRIHKWLGESISVSSIEKALKWLADNKIIVRGSRRSTKRFQLITRKAVNLAKGLVETAKKVTNPSNLTDQTRKGLWHKNNSVRKSSFLGNKREKVKNRKGNFERFHSSPERNYESSEEEFIEAVCAHLIEPTVWDKPKPPECLHRALKRLENEHNECPIKFSSPKCSYDKVSQFIVDLAR
jgi:hypothetical protein